MYVKHPTHDGDGIVAVAMPDGSMKELTMMEGVIDWPDDLPFHNRFVEAAEPEALKAAKQEEKKEELKRLAAELGLDVSALLAGGAQEASGNEGGSTQDSTGGAGGADLVAQREAELAAAEEALAADPENEELKKNVTKARTALTKAKNAVKE